MDSEGPTCFITSNTFEKKALLQSERMAQLMINTLYSYREQRKYKLHEFVIMPDHFHLILSPAQIALERAVQFIKGGFSFQAKKQFAIHGEIWQTSFQDRRIRDAGEYYRFRRYIHQNPVKRGLVSAMGDFAFSSARGTYDLDPVPQRLKPASQTSSLRA